MAWGGNKCNRQTPEERRLAEDVVFEFFALIHIHAPWLEGTLAFLELIFYDAIIRD